MKKFIRKSLLDTLRKNLQGQPNLIQVLSGPRQVGKTTLALQVFEKWKGPKIYQSADNPDVPSSKWISDYWMQARKMANPKNHKVLLVLDEVQKIEQWSSMVKRLYDEDKRMKTNIRVVLLGSSALMMKKGLTESLAGRFELHRHQHWTFSECRKFFSLGLNEYIVFGGYPGALALRKNWDRWAAYIRDSLIETVLSKDVLLMVPITKPALLRQVFSLSAAHPAEILSYQKMLGQLQDAGNTTTVASYLTILSNAFLLAPLERWSGSKLKQKGSIPKLLLMDNSLISAMSGKNYSQLKREKIFWGRMVENAVGAKLYGLLQEIGRELFYWRERDDEVDYVFEIGGRLFAVEVKSSNKINCEHSLFQFAKKYKNAELVLISPNNKFVQKGIKHITLEEFFLNPRKIL